MEFQHELVIPDEGLPFKFFLFEGSQGNYVREKHWHTSVEIFAVMEGSLTFYLNDEKYPMYGVTRHQDWWGLGSALTNKEHDFDLARESYGSTSDSAEAV